WVPPLNVRGGRDAVILLMCVVHPTLVFDITKLLLAVFGPLWILQASLLKVPYFVRVLFFLKIGATPRNFPLPHYVPFAI
ncbi:hypothetical protein DIC67_29375, partial [Klebsiella pneumoniae]